LNVSSRPDTHYARSGELQIAYQVVGEGPDLVWIPGWVSQLDLYWEEPSLVRFLRRLASFARVIVFDRRGIGLSDRVSAGMLPTLETRMDDIRAVLDDLDVRRTAIFAQGYSTPIGLLFAATYPERVSSLVLYAPSAKAGLRTDDYPWGATREEHEEWVERSTRLWGTKEFAAEWLERLAPTVADDRRIVEWTGRVLRGSGSPAASRAFTHMNAAMDVRAVLPHVHVPTLVLVRDDATAPKGGVDVRSLEEAQWVAERLPNASLATTPGRDYLPWFGGQDALTDEIETFVTGVRPIRAPERVLATVLFTDLVSSTERAAALGDRRWQALRGEHDETVRRALERFGGREIDHAGDGFLATFDGPGRAVHCALDVVRELGRLELDVRAGIHTGEVEIVDERIGGIAVHIGARVAALAGASEVLVTRTVKDLTVGSGIAFEERGLHTLRGVPGEWELYAAGADEPAI
jgi:pimeloyl-ACP methyl ester carboxylesterase/class 3 adenylate cyclase